MLAFLTHPALPQLFAIALSLLMLWVVVSDASRYVIPNTLNGCLLLLYVVACLALPINPLPALGAVGIVLVVGFGLFALGLMGGGDVKLLVALSFWTGWSMTSVMLFFLTAIFGAALVALVGLMRLTLPSFWVKRGKPLPRLLTRKQPIPYGLAIAVAFLFQLWMGMVPGLESLHTLQTSAE